MKRWNNIFYDELVNNCFQSEDNLKKLELYRYLTEKDPSKLREMEATQEESSEESESEGESGSTDSSGSEEDEFEG